MTADREAASTRAPTAARIGRTSRVIPACRAASSAGSGSMSRPAIPNRVCDPSGQGRRRLPLGRRRRHLEACQRQLEPAPARVLLHVRLCRSDEPADTLYVPNVDGVWVSHDGGKGFSTAPLAAWRRSHRLDNPTRPEGSARGDRRRSDRIDRRRQHLERRSKPTHRASSTMSRSTTVSVQCVRRTAG